MSAAYRLAPTPPPIAPQWWHRLLCRLFGHLLSFESVDAWLAGEEPCCPRCGSSRAAAYMAPEQAPPESLHERGARRLREYSSANPAVCAREAEKHRMPNSHWRMVWEARAAIKKAEADGTLVSGRRVPGSGRDRLA